MQVWNVVHVARWKHRTQKSRQKSPSGHRRTTLSGYIFTTNARIDNRKKLVKQQYVHMFPQYGELRPTSGWDPSGSLGHPYKFQRVLRLGSVTARDLVVGVSQTLRRWTEGATYVRQGDHQVIFCYGSVEPWGRLSWLYRQLAHNKYITLCRIRAERWHYFVTQLFLHDADTNDSTHHSHHP